MSAKVTIGPERESEMLVRRTARFGAVLFSVLLA
jgi:hypothetical protein